MYDDARRTITLYAARNEALAFQIVYTGRADQVDIEPLIVSDGSGTHLEAVMYRQLFVECPVVSQYDAQLRPFDVAALDTRYAEARWPRRYASPLIPIHTPTYGMPCRVDPEHNEAVWVDLFVPENAPTGIYRGELRTADRRWPVELTVWDVTLPSVSHFPSIVYIGPEEIAWGTGSHARELDRSLGHVFDAYFHMAHDHRVCLVEEWRDDDPSYITEKRRYWDHQTGRAFTGAYAPGVGFETVLLSSEVPFPWQTIAEAGWRERAFVLLHPDEPGTQADYDAIRACGSDIATWTEGHVRRVVTEQATPSNPAWGTLDDAVDVYCSGATPPADIPELERRGKAVWTYNAGYAGSPFIDAPTVACRTQAWAGFLTGARAWYFWDGGYVVDKQTRWRHARDELYQAEDPRPFLTDVYRNGLTFDEAARNRGTYDPRWAIRLNGDGLLFYPGAPVGIIGPVACVRLKNLRQGATDFEYLYLMDKAGLIDEARSEAGLLLGADSMGLPPLTTDGARNVYTAYQHEGDPWDAARIRLGQRLHGIGDAALRARIRPYQQYPNPLGYPTMYGGARY